MSYEVANDKRMLGPFASNQGLMDLVAAVSADYPALKSLLEHGGSEQVSAVAGDLDKLIAAGTDRDVKSTAEALRKLIRDQDLVVITNGIVEEEDANKSAELVLLSKADLDTPLLLRLLEFVRENEMPDETLHSMAERIERMTGASPLGMDAYAKIVAGIPAQTEKAAEVEIYGQISKLDNERRLAFGWFSIVSVNGRPVEDTQQDIITPETIENSAYEFVLNARISTEMHERDANHRPVGMGRLVESCVFTLEKQQAMLQSLHEQGIEAVLDLKCVAWWGGFKIDDPGTWSKIKTGELRAWSVGGKGRREKIAA